MRVNFRTLGCRLNEAEIETWAREFQAEGHIIVNEQEETDLLVFNSCAVTQDAVRKSKNLIRKATRLNPQAKVVLTGCYASLNPEEAEGLGVDLVVANEHKSNLLGLSKSALSFETMPALATEPDETPLFRLGRHRAFVKVQDGCRYRCTYCIVTVARGEERSRLLDDIITEINLHHQAGLQEVVLTGVHLGGYGHDLGLNLYDLILNVLQKTHIPRIRLGSLEPWDIPDGFIELFHNKRLMPHLHLPMQSGSDSVLKRMARRCRTDEFLDLVKAFRQKVPLINITTDLIVGFPGESEAEWQETLNFVEEVQFGHIHIFSFSPRAGTAAAHMVHPVSTDIKKHRSRALHELADIQKQAFWSSHLGAVMPVLWEGLREDADGNPSISGYTPNYIKVSRPFEKTGAGSHQITDIRLDKLSPDACSVLGSDV